MYVKRVLFSLPRVMRAKVSREQWKREREREREIYIYSL